MASYKILRFCLLCSLALIQGCFFLESEVNKRRVDNTLSKVEGIRTISDVTSAGIEWQLPSDIEQISGYVIYAIDDKKTPKILHVIKNPFATHYYVGKLKPQSSYNYQIAALGRQNNISVKSENITIKTSYIDPIENVFASKDLPKQIKIFWSPHPNPSIQRYIIERRAENGQFLRVGVVPHRLYVEFFDQNLEDDKAYTYRVLAESFEGALSLPSKSVSGITRKPPLPLQNITASNNLVKSILLHWDVPQNPISPIARYKIFASPMLNQGFKFLAQTKQNSYKDQNLKDGEIRYYKIIAVDADGVDGEMPNGAVEGNALPLPATPKVIAARMINGNMALLQWRMPENARQIAHFKVCRLANGGSKVCFDNISQEEFIDKEMKPQIKYQYSVQSIDANDLESLPSQSFTLGY
ncbi:fibronectin domain-containing lipoprotein [Helicobacter mustelae]|uniref:fibronectin type III domain-containing protein n=1 Tax=Helicobacter mustelae TaxID=217 RepID=UPI000E07047C|nr:fibronectin type III domain-containing protein [Helicobacter mustelae]STP12291.1 fibronectin domain-containing lipoprotein [Helicobacter mustelae]